MVLVHGEVGSMSVQHNSWMQLHTVWILLANYYLLKCSATFRFFKDSLCLLVIYKPTAWKRWTAWIYSKSKHEDERLLNNPLLHCRLNPVNNVRFSALVVSLKGKCWFGYCSDGQIWSETKITNLLYMFGIKPSNSFHSSRLIGEYNNFQQLCCTKVQFMTLRD